MPPQLGPGRIVHYQFPRHGAIECRPMIVVKVWSPECFNGTLMLDAMNDGDAVRGHLPGMLPDGAPCPTTLAVGSVNWQIPDTELIPGRWHWPERVSD